MKSFLCLLSLAYASRLRNWALGRGAFEVTYPGCTSSIWQLWAPSLSPGGTGGIPGKGGVRSGLDCQCQSAGGASYPLHLHCIGALCAVPIWQGRQLSMFDSQSIAGCPSITAFTILCPGHWAPRFLSSWTLARGFLIGHCVFSLAPSKNPPLASWPYWRQGACRNVLAVPDHLALP